MPGKYYGRRRRTNYAVVQTLKNDFITVDTTGTTIGKTAIAKAVDTPVTTVSSDVKNGCIIKAIWISLDFCGLAATGVQQTTGVYLFKNAGANLTAPSPFTVGNSNEKRFAIKSWSQMTMRNQDGNPPYHWEGWVRIPKPHQRMATDDIWQIVYVTDTAAGHIMFHTIYKYRF